MKKFNNILRVVSHCSGRNKRMAGLALVFSVLAGILDAVGVSSVMPLIGLLMTENGVSQSSLVPQFASDALSFRDFFTLKSLSLALILMFVVATLSKCLALFFLYRFCFLVEHELAVGILRGFENFDLEWRSSIDSSAFTQKLLSEIHMLLVNAVLPFFLLVSHSIIVVPILCALLFLDFSASLQIFLILLFIFSMLFFSLRGFVAGAGNARLISNKVRFSELSKLLGNFKILSFYEAVPFFVTKFSSASKQCAESQAIAQISGVMPRYIVESFGFIVLVGFLIYGGGSEDSGSNLPFIAAFAFAAYRVLPSIQQIYNANTLITYSEEAVTQILEELNSVSIAAKAGQGFPKTSETKAWSQRVVKSSKEHENDGIALRLENVSYEYQLGKAVFENLSLTLRLGECLAIMGQSGSGKTTLTNIICGLLPNYSGVVSVGNETRALSERVCLVPQDLDLIGSTPGQVFSLDGFRQFEKEKAFSLIKMLGLDAVIDLASDDWPDQPLGENCMKLSGGQKQRLAVARGLLLSNSPCLVILDEPSSALDEVNKGDLKAVIASLKSTMAVMIVTHDSDLLECCDNVLTLN